MRTPSTELIQSLSARVRPFNNADSLSPREAWIYRAACSISRTDTLDRDDDLIVRTGNACADAEERGESTCVWHEANRIRNAEYNAPACVKGVADRKRMAQSKR